MSDLHIKVSSVWKAIDNCSVKVSGAWKQVETVYVKVSGAWKTVWNNFVVSLSGTVGTPYNADMTAIDPANSVAGVRVNRNGTLQKFGISQTWVTVGNTWGIPVEATVGDGYWVRATKQSGVDPNNNNDGFGTWLNITATKEWSHIQTVLGATGPTVIKLEIATDSGGSNIVATGYYTFTATVEGTS